MRGAGAELQLFGREGLHFNCRGLDSDVDFQSALNVPLGVCGRPRVVLRRRVIADRFAAQRLAVGHTTVNRDLRPNAVIRSGATHCPAKRTFTI